MAKMDKDALIKNRFWIGLGVFAALWLVAIIVVNVSGDTTKKTAWEKAQKDIEGAKNSKPKTAEFRKPWDAHANIFRGIKEEVWRDAWNRQMPPGQVGMYTWPERMPVVPLYPEDEFGPSPEDSVNNRSKFREDLYSPQIDDLRGSVNPVEFEGGFDNVFPKQPLHPSRCLPVKRFG